MLAFVQEAVGRSGRTLETMEVVLGADYQHESDATTKRQLARNMFRPVTMSYGRGGSV
jgi:hypothetical protein